MIWQDPLNFGKGNEKGELHDFKSGMKYPLLNDEVPPFMQFIVLADCISNMALAIIGDEKQMDFTSSDLLNIALTGSVEEFDIFDNLKEMGNEFDTFFLKLVKNNFYESIKKYNALVEHFRIFKEVHLKPVFRSIIDDHELYMLILGAIDAKLTKGLSQDEVEMRQAHIDVILDYLEPALLRKVDYEKYSEDINTAFWESVMKINPCVFSLQDYKKSFGEFPFCLSHILTEHLRWLRVHCLYLLY